MNSHVYRQRSKLRMVFHQHPSWPYTRNTTSFELDVQDVIQCSVTKTLGQAAGGFTATLVPRQEYLQNINPNDWVEVFLDAGDGEGYGYPVMVASVDRVTRRRTVMGNGATQEVISLSGRDYGKVLLNIQLILDPVVGAVIDQAVFNQQLIISQYAGTYDPLQQAPYNPLNRPDQTIEALLRKYHDYRVQVTLPPTLTTALAGRLAAPSLNIVGPAEQLEGGVRLRLSDKVRGRTDLVQNPNLSGNLWGMMEQFTNPTLNELWVDTVGGVPTIFLEERPFSHDAFAEIAANTLYETEVTSEDLSKSDQDARNWLRVYPDVMSNAYEQSQLLGVGYANAAGIARVGLRKFESVTNATGSGTLNLVDYGDGNLVGQSDYSGPPTGLLQEWSGLLAEWYAFNDLLLSGTLTTRLKPKVRVGTRLDYTNERTNERMSFYVEGVAHNFQYPSAATTTITVTRGVRREGDVEPRFPLLIPLQRLLDESALVPLSEIVGPLSQASKFQPTSPNLVVR